MRACTDAPCTVVTRVKSVIAWVRPLSPMRSSSRVDAASALEASDMARISSRMSLVLSCDVFWLSAMLWPIFAEMVSEKPVIMVFMLV